MNPMIFLGICIVISAIIISVPFIIKAESKHEVDGLAAQTQQIQAIAGMVFGKTSNENNPKANVDGIDSLLATAEKQGRDPSICKKCMEKAGMKCGRILNNYLGCGYQPYAGDRRNGKGDSEFRPESFL